MAPEYTIAFYMRISDEDEDLAFGTESESITGQRLLLKDFIEHHQLSGSRIVEFVDDGYSGTDFQRPAFQSMLEKAKSREINCIAVKDFSRLGRNYLEVGNYLEQVFPFLGIRFFSVNDHFDSDKDGGAAGAIDVAFKNMIYEAYSKDLSVKIKSVKRSRAEQGKYVNAFAPYGYQKSKEDRNQLIVDEYCADIVRRIYQWYLDGINQAEITRLLNREKIPSPLMMRKNRNENIPHYQCGNECFWTAGTIARILTDERYVGAGIYGKGKPKAVGSKKNVKAPKEEWVVVQNAHPGIISEEIFSSVQQRKRNHSYKRNKEAVLAGKIVCKACNHALVRKVDPKGISYLRCSTWRAVDYCPCYRGAIREDSIESAVLNYLRLMFLLLEIPEDKKVGIKKNRIWGKCQPILEPGEQIKKEQLAVLAIYEGFKADKISKAVFQKQMIEANQRLKSLQEKRRDRQQEAEECLQNQSQEKKCGSARSEQDTAFSKLTKLMVETFVERIYVDGNGRIELFWKFNHLLYLS